MVERLGDAGAAELFRAHDHLVLELQQRWRGRLIDRSDGLLLLFERPIDGLGFALDYARGLRGLGAAHGQSLQARAGLHIGEVLTWRNSAAAVEVGAKPLEVEGLAKPMAGRLMTLARPGQILLSAVAEPLAHRAARELGERGDHLLWRSWGRWRFKGVPEALEIFEVGEPGLAPLRAPKPTAKAWRDIPLWRRPAALAAELLLVAGLATGAWFLTRPQPAIAFADRDWVVVGDLRNLTGDKVLDDSLAQAFRISLEQSRYVNVLSDLKARDTLALMRRAPGTALDRATASEIALRDGARAVILPTVAEVGGRVRVSAEVIDPRTQTTVYAESADGSGAASALASIDHVTDALRGRLGEALASIEQNSAPLPQVATANLDALRAYALGVKAQSEGRLADALQLYRRALELDPQFALAHLGQARIHFASDAAADARAEIDAALRLRTHLPPRDALYADAWAATFGPVKPMLERWRLLGQLYPDYFSAATNYAQFAGEYRNGYREALAAVGPATSDKNPYRGIAHYLRGATRAALEQPGPARADFRIANALGMTGTGQVQAGAAAAERRFDEAEHILARARGFGIASGDVDRWLVEVVLPVDRGRWDAAFAASERARAAVASLAPVHARTQAAIGLALDAVARPDRNAFPDALDAFAATERRALDDAGEADRPHAAFALLAAGYLGARSGHAGVLDQALSAEATTRALGYPLVDNLAAILHAERLRLAGKPGQAIDLLQRTLDGHELYQAHAALLRASEQAGRWETALREARWLAGHRGLAYVEYNSRYILQALNVADSNLAHLAAANALARLGREAEARRELARFDALWPAAGLTPYLRTRRDAVAGALASSF